jgi:putative transposase
LKVELDWLKKKISKVGVMKKRKEVEPGNPRISLSRQCELLGLNRSSYIIVLAGMSMVIEFLPILVIENLPTL